VISTGSAANGWPRTGGAYRIPETPAAGAGSAPLEQTASEIEALCLESLAVPANVRKSDEIANLVDKTPAKFGTTHIKSGHRVDGGASV
jgi:hypothetical protein